jgi:hypothetical protein
MFSSLEFVNRCINEDRRLRQVETRTSALLMTKDKVKDMAEVSRTVIKPQK